MPCRVRKFARSLYICNLNIVKIVNFFFRTHDYLLRNHPNSIRRSLMDKINWNDRLIGIKGSRGVGKTTFLLNFALERYGAGNRTCLYINLNHLRFTTESIVDFAGEFVSQGGKVLLIDQVYKYPGWAAELAECINIYPELQIVFTGSTVMRSDLEMPEINGLVKAYTLTGFSFREFLALKTGHQFPIYSFEQIIENHERLASEVSKLTDPLMWLQEYMHHGYYPIFLEDKNYSENLLKTMNMTLEVDVLIIRQIEQRFLHKLRKLLYLLGQRAPSTPNISNMAKEIDTSRATVMNYMNYLSEAKLIMLLYKEGDNDHKKPSMLYLDNTNISYVIQPDPINYSDVLKTFFLNQVSQSETVNAGPRAHVHFLINEKYNFFVDEHLNGRYRSDRYYAVHSLNQGSRNVIPLWLFGFLY